MVLSRFWLVIFVASIAFVMVSLFSGDSYSIDYVLNGKKDDPILVSEKYLNEIPKFIQDSIQKARKNRLSLIKMFQMPTPLMSTKTKQ